MSRARGAWALVAWLAVAAVLLLWAADAGQGLPWTAERTLALDEAGWRSSTSELRPAGSGRRLEGRAADGLQLVWFRDQPTEASSARFLHLCVDELGAEQRLLAAIVRDRQFHWLPVSGRLGNRWTIDLALAPAWQDKVDAVGIALLRVDYLPLDHAPERSPLICGAELREDNIASRLRGLAGRWFGARPWVGRSINSAGLDLGRSQPVDYLPGWALLTAWGVLLAWWAGRGSRRWALAALAAGLLLPAVAETYQQWERAAAAQVAGSALADGAQLSASPPWVEELGAMQASIAGASPSRVIVLAKDSFAREYATWLLRRFNVAGAEPSWLGDPQRFVDERAVVLVPLAEGWELDEDGRRLSAAEMALPVRVLGRGRSWLAVQLVPEGGP